jgi:hypothetical protein
MDEHQQHPVCYVRMGFCGLTLAGGVVRVAYINPDSIGLASDNSATIHSIMPSFLNKMRFLT